MSQRSIIRIATRTTAVAHGDKGPRVSQFGSEASVLPAANQARKIAQTVPVNVATRPLPYPTLRSTTHNDEGSINQGVSVSGAAAIHAPKVNTACTNISMATHSPTALARRIVRGRGGITVFFALFASSMISFLNPGSNCPRNSNACHVHLQLLIVFSRVDSTSKCTMFRA